MNDHPTQELLDAVKKGSQNWQNAFNAGDADGCAACYEPDAIVRATPLGEFNGRQQITEFWANLIGNGFSSIEYFDPQIEVLSDRSAVLSASWRMNKAHGVITKELWVIQNDGSALLREDDFQVAQ